MRINSFSDTLICKTCRWYGKVPDCRRGTENLNDDEDGLVGCYCPKCDIMLCTAGYLGDELINENAEVLPGSPILFDS